MSGEAKSKAGGEFFMHNERADGTRHLYFGVPSADSYGHAVIGKNGAIKFLREADDRIIADDKIKD